MMKLVMDKLKPARGFSYILHLGLVLLLPLMTLVLVRLQGGFVQLALSLILLSKWRMFAVRPRFWPAIIRANAVDIMVGLSAVLFMANSTSGYLQLLWAVLYAVWLLVVKPATGTFMVATQAMIGQLCGLMALFLVWSAGPLYGLIFITGIICYVTARHFFDEFDEPYAKLLSYLWAYFGAALVWVLGHWLLYYGVIAQPTLILSLIGYGLAVLYYFDHTNRLNAGLRRQFLFIMIAGLIVILAFSDWVNKVV
jgi:hypothetical protein